MASLPELLRSLDADGQRELDALLAGQESQAADIIARAKHEAAEVVRRAVEDAERQAEEEARRVLADAAVSSRELTDHAVNEGLAEVLDQVRSRVAALPEQPEGIEVTERLLAEARGILPGATRCRVHPQLVAAVTGTGSTESRTAGSGTASSGAAGRGTAGLDVSADLSAAGVILSDESGRSVDNTVPTRLASLWPRLRAELAHSWRAA